MSNFIIRKNVYNIHSYTICDVLDKYEGEEEIVTIPDGVGVVGGFQNNNFVKKIIMPNSVLALGFDAFKNCKNLEEIVFSNTLKIISVGAFNGCDNLKELIFPDSVTKIECNISSLKSLERLRIPSNFKEFTIFNCPKLKNVILPQNIKELSIQDCISLENIKLTNNLETLYFTNCDSLKNFNMPTNLRVLSLTNCKNFENFSFNEKICDFFVNGLEKLVNLVLPNSVARVGITNCPMLKNVYLPKKVCYLSSDCFKGVKNGLNITFGGNLEKWKDITKDRQTYEGGPTLNQYHYLGELAWIKYAPTEKTETTINKDFEYNLKCLEE